MGFVKEFKEKSYKTDSPDIPVYYMYELLNDHVWITLNSDGFYLFIMLCGEPIHVRITKLVASQIFMKNERQKEENKKRRM